MWPTIPADITPALYYSCVGIAVLIIGISKAGFGGGVGILALPVMAVVMPASHMLGVLLPVLIAADVLSNLHYLREYEWRLLSWLLLGAIGGVLAGTLGFWFLQQTNIEVFQTVLSLLIGSICLIVVAMQVYRLFGKEIPTLPSRPGSSLAVGFVAGGVSTLSHSAGPIVTIYLLQEQVAKRKLVGRCCFIFYW